MSDLLVELQKQGYGFVLLGCTEDGKSVFAAIKLNNLMEILPESAPQPTGKIYESIDSETLTENYYKEA